MNPNLMRPPRHRLRFNHYVTAVVSRRTSTLDPKPRFGSFPCLRVVLTYFSPSEPANF